MLDTQMADTDVSGRSNLFAGRAVYNVDSEWRVGGLVTRGDPLGQSDNTLTSLDSTWSTSTFQGDKNLNLSAGWRIPPARRCRGDRSGYGFDAEYPNDLWYADVNYSLFGDALDPALGFLQRPAPSSSPAPSPGSHGRRGQQFLWVRQFFENVGCTT